MFDFKNSIFQVTSEKNDLEFDQFKTAFDKGIQRHAPTKKLYVRKLKRYICIYIGICICLCGCVCGIYICISIFLWLGLTLISTIR